MSEPIKPALTPEEWRRALSFPPGIVLTDDGSASRHSMAAVCLYGQPFGFTHEDVRLLRQEAEDEWNGADLETGRLLLGLADRIEALLPPEKSS